jgi:hypothetical protein
MRLSAQIIFLAALTIFLPFGKGLAKPWQQGFPEPKNSEKSPGSPLPAAVAAQGFQQVPQGLAVQVFAS